MRDDGTVRYSFQNAKESLALFGAVARGRDRELRDLADAFESETDHGQEMAKYDRDGEGGAKQHCAPVSKEDADGIDTKPWREDLEAVGAAEKR